MVAYSLQKQEESKQGKQHVANTPKAKDSRKKAQQNGSKNDGDDKATTSNQRGSRSQTRNVEAKKYSQGAAQGKSKDENEDDDDDDDDDDDSQSQEEPAKSAKTGQKRKNNEEHDSEPKSKTKKSNGTIGSKHMVSPDTLRS